MYQLNSIKVISGHFFIPKIKLILKLKYDYQPA